MPRLDEMSSGQSREAKLFRNNKSQAVRIPADFEFECEKVTIHREGERLIIEPVRKRNLLDILADMPPLDEEDQFPDIDKTLKPLRNIEL